MLLQLQQLFLCCGMTKKPDAHIELDDFWPYQVVVLADQISRHTLSVVREQSGLNLSQWRVLAAVAGKPGRSAAEVTSVTPMDKTIVSRAVASLIEIGLIQKSPTSRDKRRQSLATTEAGLEIYTKISKHLNRKLINPESDTGSAESFIELLKNYSAHMQSINTNTSDP